MYRSIAIIGSFQKYYEDICGVISFFKQHGCQVTSPYLSQITHARDAFVVFEADDQTLSNDEIQTDTLRKILNADAVYVYNLPNESTPTDMGYVGKTTCYEIGILMAKNKPIYYLYPPYDLPVPVNQKQILSPQDFVNKFIAGDMAFLLPKKDRSECNSSLKAVFAKPSLLICGSMSFFSDMEKVQKELEALGVDAITPDDEADLPKDITPEAFNEFKRKVSQNYLKKIRNKGTIAILILNEKKNGVSNYIGTNTLAEAVMAFTWKRKIFVYNDIYAPLADELIAWEAVAIRRNLGIVKNFFDENRALHDTNVDLFSDAFDDDEGS